MDLGSEQHGDRESREGGFARGPCREEAACALPGGRGAVGRRGQRGHQQPGRQRGHGGVHGPVSKRGSRRHGTFKWGDRSREVGVWRR